MLNTANSNPLRILHVNSMLTGGGTDDQCVKLAQGLRQLGHDVWLAGPEERELSTIVKDQGLSFHTTPPENLAKISFILSVAMLIKHKHIQIVHAHHGRDLWPAILAAKLSGVRPKIVVTRHLAKSLHSRVSRCLLLSQCDALIAVSNFTAKILREGAYEPESLDPKRRTRLPLSGDRSKISVVHCGIDTNRFRPFDASAQRYAWGLAPEHFVFAVVGGYDHPRGKGQREFLRAAAWIHAYIPNARFLIIGRGTLQSTLENDIREYGLGPKAQLISHCHNMPLAMNAIDCLVHPAVGTEAFGLVVCEAHACGKPVIASALDGIPEAFQVGGYGQLVQPGNVEELAPAMHTWAEIPPLDKQGRMALHAKIEQRLSIAVAALHVQDIYHSILSPAVATAHITPSRATTI
ncbi:MAG TPA: glycosyltransferase [Gammaproteobacteria bacterium]|nr:glycosyltransferase [Gammaproteobacteria bacterium]